MLFGESRLSVAMRTTLVRYPTSAAREQLAVALGDLGVRPGPGATLAWTIPHLDAYFGAGMVAVFTR